MDRGKRKKEVFVKKILLLFVFVLCVFAKEHEVTFEYKAPYKAEVVYVTGDFANWNPTAYRMTYFQAEDIWRKTLKLKEGKYHYKFVINGSDWRYDPKNPQKVEDGYGGFNSVLTVGEAFKISFNEKTGDGKIADAGIGFSTDDIEFFNPYMKGRIRFFVRTAKNDVEGVFLNISGAKKTKYKMSKFFTDSNFDWWIAYVQTKGKELKFYFSIKDAGTVRFLGENGVVKNLKELKKFYLSDTFENMLETPHWAKNVVWYQIMVDRFRNGSEENDPPGTLPFSWDWFKKTEREKREGFYKVVWDRKFGGDLIGVYEKLGYLNDLGITGIYFNPVFKSESYQKYNTDNYLHIDDTFYKKGDIDEVANKEDLLDPFTWKYTPTDKYFFDFISQAHSKGIRIIIDGVFNHSGEKFPAFVDLKKNGKNSKFKDWYVVTDWNVFETQANMGKGYIGWAGFGGLPEFNEDENGLVPPVRDFIFNVTRRWLKPGADFTGIDGWRLDVPMCIKKPFWLGWRKVVKNAKPQAFTVGEIWTKAGDWLNKGETFDAVMNYELAKAIVKFFIDKRTKISATEFDKKIRELLFVYPYQIALVQYNLTNSHDTDRIASMIKNPDRVYNTKNRLQNPDGRNYDNSPPTKKDYEILKLIWSFEFFYPGCPSIYYGDEVGMWGADDPNNRKPMWWEDIKYENKNYRINYDLKNFVRKLIAARNTYPVLRLGEFYPVMRDDARDVLVYKRIFDDEVAFLVVNNSDKKQVVEIRTNEPLWNVFKGGKIEKITKSLYAQKISNNEVALSIFPDKNAKINVISIKRKADFVPKDGEILIKIPAKKAVWLVNKKM